MTFGMTLKEHITMAVSASSFYIQIVCKNKTNMKVAAWNINIKMHQQFSKQRILGVSGLDTNLVLNNIYPYQNIHKVNLDLFK